MLRGQIVTQYRTRIGLTVALLVSTVPATAQVRIGAVGASNLASISSDGAGAKLSSLARWGVGGAIEVDLNEDFALVSRPMYLGKGVEIEVMPEVGNVSSMGKGSYARTELSYLELPLLLKYSLPTAGARPYLIAGPSLGLRRSADAVYKFGSDAERREDIEKDFKSTDLSLQAGAGIGVNVGRAYLFAEGLYAFGLTNINENKAEGTGKNRGPQFRVGVTLNLSGR